MKFRRTLQQIIHGAFRGNCNRELPFDQLAPDPVEEQGGPLLLQLLDCLRECSLANAKLIRRPRDPSVLGDRDYVFEHAEVDAVDPIIEVSNL